MTVPSKPPRDAMRRLNMTREAFASRIGVSRRALDTWFLPDDSQESRGCPEIVERFVSEIVERSVPEGGNYTQSVDNQGLPSSSFRGQAATAVGRPVLAGIGRGAVSRGRRHAADRAPPQDFARAGRCGAR